MTTPQFSGNLFLQKLHDESRHWVDENILSPEQRDAILCRCGISCGQPCGGSTARQDGIQDTAKENKEFPVFLQVILAIGVLLVGLAVLLLVSFNWKYLNGTAKLSIVGAMLAAAHAGGFALRTAGRKLWAEGTFFFAGIMYGVGIWQIGQVFNMPADLPAGLHLWAAGVFLLALVLASTPLHIASVLLLAAWVIAEVSGSLNVTHAVLNMFFGNFIPLSAWTLPVFAAAGIIANVLQQKKLTATLYVFLIGFWWMMQGIRFQIDAYQIFHIAATGLIFFALSACRFRSISNTALERVGFLILTGALTMLSFQDYWNELLYYRNYGNSNDSAFRYRVLWGFALPVIDLLILYGLVRLRHRWAIFADVFRRNRVFFITAAAVFAMWFSVYFASLIFPDTRRNTNSIAAGIMMIAGNVLLVYFAVALMLGGLKRERPSWFWGGTFLLLFWTFLRYFDLFHHFGMLGTAAVFGLCGLFMLGVVYFWTTRRNKFRSGTMSDESFEEPVMLLPFWAKTLGSRLRLFWSSERSVLAAAALTAALQFAVLGIVIANEMTPHLYGTLIRVETAPVDPRDIFRGDYVVLNYDFSVTGSVGMPDSGAFLQRQNIGTVYVSMKQEGDVWKAAGFSRKKPQEGIFLKGTYRHGRITYGIESYYVQEGTGKVIEAAMRQQRRNGAGGKPVIVELLVTPNGKAAIRDVKICD
ncbi:MAG: GDYXXLXY domain-containing protein [Planctomycetaceae bacterium]|jgi:uncharacterized membrane-anchored protein/uncharacterized membrane protein|nr:GDYXXLXY domain-containing protein [Planctomycetaceae bacterium]